MLNVEKNYAYAEAQSSAEEELNLVTQKSDKKVKEEKEG